MDEQAREPGVARTVHLVFESHLDVMPDELWTAIASMRAVNEELSPLVRMTYPSRCGELSSTNASLAAGFTSWILLFGAIPIDRHQFGFDHIADGSGFSERSSSLLHRSWRHERQITDAGSGASRLRDELAIEPRLAGLAPIVRRGVRYAFRRRHRHLRRRFGAIGE